MSGQLSLIRAAVVRIGEVPYAPVGTAEMRLGDAVVASGPTLTIEGAPAGDLVVAAVPISGPIDLEAECIAVPEAERSLGESAIEMFARLFAIDRRSSHAISSPFPYVGFASDDNLVLDKLIGKRVNQPVMCVSGPVGSGRADILDEATLSQLRDRVDGVALLAEALSSTNALGRYIGFVRLFERAFARQAWNATQHMVPFLTDPDCPHGFTKKEIHTWIDARGRAAHADRRPDFLLEANVRPWVGRMEEAAYDLLLNKEEWREPSSARRRLWKAASGSTDPDAGIYMTKGANLSLAVQALDGYRAYPLMLAGPLDQVLPAGVWLEGDAEGGFLRRLEGGATFLGLPS